MLSLVPYPKKLKTTKRKEKKQFGKHAFSGAEQPTNNKVEDKKNGNPTTQSKDYLNMEYISPGYEPWCCNIKQSGSDKMKQLKLLR
jgi:hypothetical protein